uniref:dr1-associated corepressor-like n=1 Tax=Erigeron canadensis TaxID=72917 RepID=UPI001CB92312|nr:dr1-associated corepressor-like [Erigeron canadensis]
MRKKLDTRFPAARIKKIMQADEDVGKIALAVPLLVSKSLELFLQDLCDRTYEITLQSRAKTLNSAHLKQCVQSFNVFDFLRDIVSKVPDLGGTDAAGEDRPATKRRKVADDDHNEVSDEDLKTDVLPETSHANGGGRGRRGGRGRGRISRVEREANADKQKQTLDSIEDSDSKDSHISAAGKTKDTVNVRNFDLNLDLDENGEAIPILTTPATPVVLSPPPTVEMIPVEYPGWSLADVEKMAIDPVHFANYSVDEDEEDYDEE